MDFVAFKLIGIHNNRQPEPNKRLMSVRISIVKTAITLISDRFAALKNCTLHQNGIYMVGETLLDRIVTDGHNYLSPNINITCGRSGGVVSKPGPPQVSYVCLLFQGW